MQPRDGNQSWKSFLYKIRQLMIAFLATSGRCKRALWDPSGGSPIFSMDGLGTKQSSLVPTVWNYPWVGGVMATSLCTDPPVRGVTLSFCYGISEFTILRSMHPFIRKRSWTSYHTNRITYTLDIFPLETFHASKTLRFRLN